MKQRRWFLGMPILAAVAWLLLWMAVGAAPAGPWFSDSGQQLGNDTTFAVTLVDVDGDADLDLVSGDQGTNRVWLNDGSGFFTASNQQPGNDLTEAVVAGDLNGDEAVDLLVINRLAGNQIWLNDGSGRFSWDGSRLNPAGMSYAAALADFDDDDDLDLFVANDGANTYWLNDGVAGLTMTQTLGQQKSLDVAIADLDGDDDPDVYVANGNNSGLADEIWLNEAGQFTPSVQPLSTGWNEGVAVGDLDGDDDPDLFLANWSGSDAVWLNDGLGVFSLTTQSLSGAGSTDVLLLDLDADDDLDAVVAKWVPAQDEIWLNDGQGNFSLSGQTLDSAATHALAAGDLDNDLDMDLVLGNFGPNGVWLRGGAGTPTPWFELAARENPAGHDVYPWVQPGPATLPVVLSGIPAGPTTVLAEIETPAGLVTDTINFAAGQQTGTLAVANPNLAPAQPITLTLSLFSGRTMASSRRVNPLTVTFIAGDAGDVACTLCYADWLLKLLGFETSFWAIHHMQFAALRETLSWDYYSGQFSLHAQELSHILATNPILLWQTFDALELWMPALAALDDGQGQSFIVTEPMATAAQALFTGIQAEADPALAAQIAIELARLDFPGTVGQPVAVLEQTVAARVQVQLHLPLVSQP